MKTVKVTYTFEVTQNVAISEETPPKPYTPEEWEKQQIEDVGNAISDAMPRGTDWFYARA